MGIDDWDITDWTRELNRLIRHNNPIDHYRDYHDSGYYDNRHRWHTYRGEFPGLIQALLAERERSGKLRAALKRALPHVEFSARHTRNAQVSTSEHIADDDETLRIIYDALREDGEGRDGRHTG